MKTMILLIVLLTPCTVCASIAGYMAIHGYEGWGWFLFLALVLSSISLKSNGE